MHMFKSSSMIALAVAFAGCATDAADEPGADEAQLEPAAEPTCATDVSTHATSCFETFTAAIAHATGGQVTDAPNDAHAYATNVALRERVERSAGLRPAAAYVIGVQYKDANYRGDAWVYYGPHPCVPGFSSSPEYEAAAMPSGWNDEISSFIAANNCKEVLYAEGGCMGLESDVNQADFEAYVGDGMNDKTSCIRWF